MRGGGRLALLALVAGSAVARPAAAYDFTVGLRTIGQGYQVRRFAADGNNELLSRRRLTQYMDLAVFDIAPVALARRRRRSKPALLRRLVALRHATSAAT